MPLSSRAETQLRQMLQDFRAAHTGAVVPTGAGMALEVWVMLKLAHTVHRIMSSNWSVTLRRGDGSLLPAGDDFNLPNGGSGIPASDPTAPGYILLQHRRHPERSLELRLNLRWIGRSGTRHEIDVSALPGQIGEALRDNGGGYPHGLPVLAIECKDKPGDGVLDEMRQKLARMYDLVLVTRPAAGWSCRIFETAANTHWGRRSSRYTAAFQTGVFGVVRVGGFQSGAVSLADHYSIRRFGDVFGTSGSIAALQTSFRGTVAGLTELM